MRRNWIKLFVDQCLRGTMMDEMKDPAERFVWFGILLLTGDSPYEGKIALTEDMGYSDEQLGSLLKCEANIVRSAKEKMIKHEKIKVLENNVIQVLNWKKYQSEYDRQKKYRQSSPEWKMNYSMGVAIYNALKSKKNGLSWEIIVGYTRGDLVKHLELLFQKGMNWNNYGEGWHIDHIVPRSSFTFSDQNDSEFQRCWSLENLQPLWKEINLAKSNKMGLHIGVTTKGDRQIERREEEDRELDIDRDLEEDTKTTETLILLSKVKNYPYSGKKDLEFINKLKAEFPDVDVIEKITQIMLNWLKFPLNKKSRPRVQIRRWVTNEQKWQKEGQQEKRVGESSHAPSEKEDDYDKARAIKMKELQEKYQPEIDKATKAHASDWLDEIDNKIKEEIAEFSRNYQSKEGQ